MRAPSVLTVALLASLLVGCHDARQGPCDEPIEPIGGKWGGGPVGGFDPDPSRPIEAPNAKLVHLVTFSMGPVTETLEGVLVLRAPDAFRLFGLTETGQRAFDVAWVSSNGQARVKRLYRAPFLGDDRALDLIAAATARIFLLRARPLGAPAGDHVLTGPEETIERDGVRFFYGGQHDTLRWFEGPKFSACFMSWKSSNDGKFLVPERIHYQSAEGPYPYTLTLKLIEATALATPPPDSLFDPPPKHD